MPGFTLYSTVYQVDNSRESRENNFKAKLVGSKMRTTGVILVPVSASLPQRSGRIPVNIKKRSGTQSDCSRSVEQAKCLELKVK